MKMLFCPLALHIYVSPAALVYFCPMRVMSSCPCTQNSYQLSLVAMAPLLSMA